MILERGDILINGQTIQEMKLQDMQVSVAQMITQSKLRCYRKYVNNGMRIRFKKEDLLIPKKYLETFKIVSTQIRRKGK